MKTNTKQISKFLSLILRHNPGKIGLELDENGWANVGELINKANTQRKQLNIDILKEVVETNDKKRFAFNEDETKIRANQGHSIQVDLEYTPIKPPEFLYHGTVGKFREDIKRNGLLKMNRHHVHLSEERETAMRVGSGRGVPIILTVRSGDMYRKGIEFYQSDNGVWLTDMVAPEYIEFKA
ncbi:RNA 2'-phosphotransferase [Aquimarina sp. MMG016]|uniref:RNA 2'-phosphotransferase n=1 Tax=Aquimarina sp. MMG016 TaxID=2822690 RepID=UPI001B3A292C|nr:RNA 2'-phosphotransferase [Aquimarina sp. MMG016]MBQ4822642.1 RNA 2'-phosphotransferase [Aquimarina sp. MMG016]